MNLKSLYPMDIAKRHPMDLAKRRKNIISGGRDFTVGLKPNGTAVSVGAYGNGQHDVDVGDGWYMIDETGSDYDGWRLSGYITADGKISMTMFYYNDYTGTYSFYCDFTMVEQYVS